MPTIDRIAFKGWHIDAMAMHAAFRAMKTNTPPEELEECSEAYTWIDMENHRIIAAVGAAEYLPGAYQMWAYMSNVSGLYFLPIHKFCLRWFAEKEAARFEATVLDGFKPGHKWMKMLGFDCETLSPMRKWDGERDYYLYSRVR